MQLLAILYILHYLISSENALKIYKSTNMAKISGLQYKKDGQENVILSHSLTTCIRFEFKRLSQSHLARILTIKNSKSQDIYPNFLRIYARYPETWMSFGNDELGTGYKSSWILKDIFIDSYLIWEINKWHHICFAYFKSKSEVILI